VSAIGLQKTSKIERLFVVEDSGDRNPPHPQKAIAHFPHFQTSKYKKIIA
jgi:hypothetical protein